VRFAFASGVWARTGDLRRLFRCLTLGAAVLARRCHARTEWVCTLLRFLRSHFLSSQLRIKIVTIQVQMLAPTKECFCIERNTLRRWFAQSELWMAIRYFRHPAAASLRTAGAEFWALRVATLRVSNCEQMFADSGVVLCAHSVGSETKTVIVCCLVF
jgi:hypothetical protein